MGGHEHGHEHHAPYKVPKASIYHVSDAPQLVEVQEALAKRGLKDPWLRNEVWRYNPKLFGTHRARVIKFFLTGLPVGIAAFLVTIAVEKYIVGRPFFTGEPKHGHGHGHGNGDGH